MSTVAQPLLAMTAEGVILNTRMVWGNLPARIGGTSKIALLSKGGDRRDDLLLNSLDHRGSSPLRERRKRPLV